MKDARAGLPKAWTEPGEPLKGRMLALIFERPSTRTRVSFDVGMRQMGGETLVLSANDMQAGRGETIADTARVLSRYVDAIMIRAARHSNLMELAEAATVPVINGLTNVTHPCQVMADVMTLEEHVAPLKNLTVSWVGDGNNVAASWIHAVGRLGGTLKIGAPARTEPRARTDELGQGTGCGCAPHAFARGSRGRLPLRHHRCLGVDARYRCRQPPQSAEALSGEPQADGAGRTRRQVHALPSRPSRRGGDRRGDGQRGLAVFDEAENRLHVQKSILLPLSGCVMAAPDPSADDLVMPFEIKPLGVRGRLVRLGAAVDDILHRHSYPPPVSALLAEAVALTAMLGAALKFDGKFILQTKTDGPVDMLVADYVSPAR